MKPHSDFEIAVVGRQIPSLHSSQPPEELPMISLWMTPGMYIPWLLDPSYLSISSFQWTRHHLQWQRSKPQHQSQYSCEWYLVRRGHMLWRNRVIHPRLPCRESHTCNSRPRMVSGMLVRREETDWGAFLGFWRLIVLSTRGFRQKSPELLCFAPFLSVGEATDTFERAPAAR